MLAWTIGEGHRRARDEIVRRLNAALFDPTVHGYGRETVASLVDAFRTLAGDTHTVCIDETLQEVFEARIDRSRRKLLH